MTTPLFIDVHVLQTVPPSNLNRDDAGTPKQATYGGVRRARVSSQAWKRATRKAFDRHLSTERLGTRTKRIAILVARNLDDRAGVGEEAAGRIAAALLKPLGITGGKKAQETSYMLFVAREQIERLVALVADRADELAALTEAELDKALEDGGEVQRILSTGHSVDVALFGRMVADLANLNVDAAVQVAHALSTHVTRTEFDYYTAVEDETGDEETGAGMIGTIEFNSATLYRYATVAVPQLVHNLGGDQQEALNAVRLFIESFVTSIPSGHQNSFAHQTVPHLVSLVVRRSQPVNLVSAFESPAKPRKDGGVAQESQRLLVDELDHVGRMWGLAPDAVNSVYRDTEAEWAETLGAPKTLVEAIDATVAEVEAALMSGQR